jgi:hypothetical protein
MHEVKDKKYRILVGNPGGKRSVGRPRYKLEDIIKKRPQRHRMGWFRLDSSGSG